MSRDWTKEYFDIKDDMPDDYKKLKEQYGIVSRHSAELFVENERLKKQLIKAKNILADLTFSAPCDSILHCQIKEKAEKFFKEIGNEDRIFAYMGKPVDALTYLEKKIEHERKELEK